MATCPLLSRNRASHDNEDFGSTIGNNDLFDPAFYRRWFNMEPGRQQPSSQQGAGGCPMRNQSGPFSQWFSGDSQRPGQPGTCPMGAETGTSVPVNPDKFTLRINTRNFTPQDITVKTEGSDLLIHGKHAEKSDGRGCHVSREFTRRYELPEDVEPETVKCEFMPSGDLVIEAKRKEAPKPLDKPVPIEVQHVPDSDDEEERG